jgi:CBS domain-containing protein
MKVEQVMTQTPEFCTVDDRVEVAAEIMRRVDTGIVPVVRRENNQSKLVGVVTDRDLCLGILADGKDPSSATVGEFMSKNVTSCKPSDTVAQALLRMKRSQVRRLPVVNPGGAVVGILSLADIVRSEAAKKGEFCETMAAICAPTKTRATRKRAAA